VNIGAAAKATFNTVTYYNCVKERRVLVSLAKDLESTDGNTTEWPDL